MKRRSALVLKVLKNTILFLCILIIVTGCCTQKTCDSATDQTRVQFVGFDWTTLDSVRVEVFRMETDARVDSYSVKAYWEKPIDNRLIDLHHPLNLRYYYKFYTVPDGKTYLLESFETEDVVCNTCVSKTDYVEKLKSYTVNGYRVYFQEINISRYYPINN